MIGNNECRSRLHDFRIIIPLLRQLGCSLSLSLLHFGFFRPLLLLLLHFLFLLLHLLLDIQTHRIILHTKRVGERDIWGGGAPPPAKMLELKT